ncbi:hypothetical protein JMJ35_001876 [Cladonia borealis]|uniref:Rhodopsin domain-containing protein n=1 Tax=Cladonia borealis TaxID=184061 RepID=A0AA39R6J6_9LECA|nr:hypothetical protein JMJ35_001876 [Cladonia borealis]
MSSTEAPAGGNQNRGPHLVGIFWAEAAVASLVILLRISGRLMIRQLGLDDYMMVFTLLLFVILASFTTHLAIIGGCRHLFYLSPQQQLQAVKYNWISQPWGIFGFATGKISVALLILRIMGPNTIWRKWILYGCMASVLVINAIGSILTFVQCNPPRALWTPTIHAHCWNPKVQSDYAIFLSSWNVFIDVVLAMLPISILWPLTLSLRKKISLSVLLGLGLLAAICGSIKIKYLAGLTARSDLTWETYNLYVWSASELFVIMTCGSIPPIKSLYDHFFGSKKHHRTGYTPYNDSDRSRELKFNSKVKETPRRLSEGVELEPL